MRIVFLLLLSFFLCNACSPTKKALQHIEKNKFQEARSLLKKALTKDSLNADVYYVLAQLYLDTAYNQYNIDSSYAYVLEAQSDYQLTQAKTRAKQQKQIGLDSLSLRQLHLLNDSLAYQRATRNHTVTAYQDFLNQHPNAMQVSEATRFRNQLAYQAASQLDTYVAYQDFMNGYPEAEEYSMAQERYNTLIFREKTRSGDLQSYYDFLEAFPNTPFRSEAEKQILDISTSGNRIEDYERFIKRYPESPHVPLAMNLLYHLYIAQHPADSFFEKYSTYPLIDSLKQAEALSKKILSPIFSEGKYKLMDHEGDMRISANLKLLPARYFCKGISSALVYAIVEKSDQTRQALFDKKGSLLYERDVDDSAIEPDGKMYRQHLYALGAGMYLLKDESSAAQLLLASGKTVLPNANMSASLDSVAMLPSDMNGQSVEAYPRFRFIKYQLNGLWGVATFTGRVLLEAQYDEIDSQEEFVFFKKGDRFAVTKYDHLAQVANQRPLSLEFKYDDVSLLDQHHLIGYLEDSECVLDRNLKAAVPLDRYNIIKRISSGGQNADRWLIRKDRIEAYVKNDSLMNRTVSAYFLYPPEEQQTSGVAFSDVSFGSHWMSLKNKDGFLFYDFAHEGDPLPYDSVKLVGENFALLFKYFDQGKDSVIVNFPNQRRLALASPQNISFLLLQSSSLSTDREYLLIAPRQGPKEIWNQYGKRVYMGKFDDVKTFGPGLFAIEKNRRKGLLDSLGNELLPYRYEEISNYQDSLLALFQNRKFGAYDYASRVTISPDYGSALQRFGSSVYHPEDSSYSQLYIARKKGKFGIVNSDEETVAPFVYDQIRHWNDTAALAKQGASWMIVSLDRKNPVQEEEPMILYNGIEEFQLLEKTGEETLYKIYREGGYGVLSNVNGELLPPTYDDIRLFGSISNTQSIFLAEKYVPEAELYIVIHLNISGKIIQRQALTSEQYDKVFCDD